MDKFNSDDHYICYCLQESLRKNGLTFMVTKESKMQYLSAISKMMERSLFISKAKIQYHSNPRLCPVIQVYAPATNANEVEVE